MRKKSKNLPRLFLYTLLPIILIISVLISALILVESKSKDSENKGSSGNNEILTGLEDLKLVELVHELPCRLRNNVEYKTNTALRERLNEFITEKFKRCNLEYYSFNSKDYCYIGNIYHYVDIKTLLNGFDENEREQIAYAVKNTYEKDKNIFVKDYLAVRDNRLWHALSVMSSLGLLNESEKKFWISQYSKMKFNES